MGSASVSLRRLPISGGVRPSKVVGPAAAAAPVGGLPVPATVASSVLPGPLPILLPARLAIPGSAVPISPAVVSMLVLARTSVFPLVGLSTRLQGLSAVPRLLAPGPIVGSPFVLAGTWRPLVARSSRPQFSGGPPPCAVRPVPTSRVPAGLGLAPSSSASCASPIWVLIWRLFEPTCVGAAVNLALFRVATSMRRMVRPRQHGLRLVRGSVCTSCTEVATLDAPV